MAETAKRIRVPDLKEKKKRGEKIVMLAAYDATMARLLDRAGIDILLVGDSLGMVIQGGTTTTTVTMDDMVYHARIVARGVKTAHLMVDMPFMSYQASVEEAVRSAGRLVKEGGAESVKLEGGRERAEAVRAIDEAHHAVHFHAARRSPSGGCRDDGRRPARRRSTHRA